MNSPIKWVGGKSNLINTLIPLIPKHNCYVEVFGGAGWLLFRKNPSNVEILNDYDNNLMNFYNVVKNEPKLFIESFKYTLVSRTLFNEYKKKYKIHDFKDNIDKAHIFYYLVNAGFASDMNDIIFGTKCQSRNGLRIEQIEQSILTTHKRLQKVTIENKSFEGIFKTYDDKDTFFFLDSPYRNSDSSYAVGKFTDEQYNILFDCCKNSKGKWLYTINDDDYIKDLFKDFNFITHEVYYSVCGIDSGRRKFKELIITNYNVNTKLQNKLF